MQDARLCKELLQRILPELEIDHVEYPEAQKSIRPDADAKCVRLDVSRIPVNGKILKSFLSKNPDRYAFYHIK